MKKLLLTAVGWVIACSLSGQTFQKYYELAGKGIHGFSVIQLTDTIQKDLVWAAWGMDTGISTPAYINTTLITKTDSNGNVLSAMRRDTSNGMIKLLETHDYGFLHIDQYLDHLEVTKYDNMMSQQWSTQFPHPNSPFLGGGGFDMLDAIRVHDPMGQPGFQDWYYISFSTAPEDTNYYNDKNIYVIKLDEQGGLVWKRCYVDSNRAAYNTEIQENAFSITSYESPHYQQRVIAISGNKDVQFPYNDNYILVFLIDENGDPLTGMKHISTGDYDPSGGSILWDGDSLVMTYLEENSGTINPDPSQVSGVGILKFDEQFTGYRGRYLWEFCENVPVNITLDIDGNYVVHGEGGMCSTPLPPYYGQMSMKIERNTLDPVYYHRYETSAAGQAGTHMTDQWGYHYLIGSISMQFGLNQVGMAQFIKTDGAGRACRFDPNPTLTEDYTPTDTTHAIDYTEHFQDSLLEDFLYFVDLKVYPCYDVTGDAGRGETTGLETSTQDAERILKARPSVMYGTHRSWMLRLEQEQTSVLELEIYDQASRLMYSSTWSVQAGISEMELPVNLLAKGLNIIRISGNDQAPLTLKVIRAE